MLTMTMREENWKNLGKTSISPNVIEELNIKRNTNMLTNLLSKALQYSAKDSNGSMVYSLSIPHDILSTTLRIQIRSFVITVSEKYHAVGFHSFDHASHVLLSATKLVSMLELKGWESCHSSLDGTIHNPWLHFAICFAALLHDVDHKGIPNRQLAAEQDPLARRYGSKECMGSYAEWNSFDIGLALLDLEEYSSLKQALSINKKFFGMMKDLILCTDIASKERRELGIQRWKNNFAKKNFSKKEPILYTEDATRIIADQIMQAADVSHTMQHFETFLKWNQRLFHEILSAHQNGREANMATISHPAENWYEGQICFFDHYVIPLATRLDCCGAFQEVDETNFESMARYNRDRWEQEGRALTKFIVESTKKMELLPPMPQTVLDVTNHEHKKCMSCNSKDTDNKNDDHHEVNRKKINFDQSVNAIVPNVLVRQIVSSLQHEITTISQNDPRNVSHELLQSYCNKGSIHRHHGALLFVDISGFTNLSQNYPVEDFKTFINDYFTKIINLIVSFGGEVIKFAGDALYAFWCSKCSSECICNPSREKKLACKAYASLVEKCVACAIAINLECNDYKISKSYCRRGRSISGADCSEVLVHVPQGQEHALYTITDKDARYERREAMLNVHCGVSEGVMAGVDVVAGNRAEFFFVGQPLTDVSTAEYLAEKGELVISPSAYWQLQNAWESVVASEFVYAPAHSGYYKVTWPNCPPAEIISSALKMPKNKSICTVSGCYFKDNLAEIDELQNDITKLLKYHHHEAARDEVGKFSAELRRVVVIFINIMYEPGLSKNSSEDGAILDRFQCIFTILSKTIASYSGQVRQFMRDDKGTVFIASFGLRGSVSLDSSAIAIDAAKDAQNKLLQALDIQSTIGITLGTVYCGETGSNERYEYSLLGPPVNLSARLMAKGSPGQIICDEEIKQQSDGKHSFVASGTHKLKGYKHPVPFFVPCSDDVSKLGETNKIEKDAGKLYVRKKEIKEIVEYIQQEQKCLNSEAETQSCKPRAIIVTGKIGAGKNEFISGILHDSNIRNSTTVLETNHCYHEEPFYCWIPVIHRIILSSPKIRKRLIMMKKREPRRRCFLLSSLVQNEAFQLPSPISYDDLVPDDLNPYLRLVNDFVFQGFPVLLSSSKEAKQLKGDAKVDKCVEVISAMIKQFIERNKKSAIISIRSITGVDSYSKQLIQHLFHSRINLIILGNVKGSCDILANTNLGDRLDPTQCIFLQSIFSSTTDEDSSMLIKTVHLEYLSKESVLDLFLWSLRDDILDEDYELMLISNELSERINQICCGMPHLTILLARAFGARWKIQSERFSVLKSARMKDLERILNEIPTAIEDLVCMRFDQLSPEEQMLLKIASVAGFDQYSFSQGQLEEIVLGLSRTEKKTEMYSAGKGNNESQNEGASGNDIPSSVGNNEEVSELDYMFQEDYFEQTLESLIQHNFLEEVEIEMSDFSSFESVMYRFRDSSEQSVINGLMLEDQKRRTHFEVAQYYSTLLSGNQIEFDDTNAEDFTSFTSMSDITSIPTNNWQIQHIIGLHYDLAGISLMAMLHYYESSIETGRLGVRDRSHGSLLSAYLMLEKVLYEHQFNVELEEKEKKRQLASLTMVKIISDDQYPESLQKLSQLSPKHLRLIFKDNIDAFKTCLIMLTKFGQSVGPMEKEGHKLGCDIYIRTIYLLLLVLEDTAFAHLLSDLSPLMGPDFFFYQDEEKKIDETIHSDGFFISDLKFSFPAFSGLLTYYRDSPLGVKKEQETFLANLFVAITKEANEIVHTIRTKCILCHLYLKHGEVTRALEESERLKEIYDHDSQSSDLVTLYGMDWAVICIGTMSFEYAYRGEFNAAFQSIKFLELQLSKLNEFASSTKPMMKGITSSFFLLLKEFGSSLIANGISETEYKYFYRPHGILQEGLAKKESELNNIGEESEMYEDDYGVLSILMSDNLHTVNLDRPMFNQSAETLSDRGIEAIKAAICFAEIRKLERDACTVEIKKRQLLYCQAGLAYLSQSLEQEGAKSYERQTNYLACLIQKAELLYWHKNIIHSLSTTFDVTDVRDIFKFHGSEINVAKTVLCECEDLSKLNDLLFILLVVGKCYIRLGINIAHGEGLIASSLHEIQSRRSIEDYHYAKKYLSSDKIVHSSSFWAG